MAPRLNIPPITRVVLITLLVQSIISFAIRYQQKHTFDSDIVVPYIQLVPQLSLIYPWTFLTTTLVENNVVTLAISGVTLFYGGRYLERSWTSQDFAKFLLITALIPNILTFAALVIFFALTGDLHWTLTSVNGTIPLQISFLVAFSQLVPAHTVTLFRGIVSLRVPRFPLIHVLAIFLLSLTPLLSSASFFLVLDGFLVSWVYLRFYKPAFPDVESQQGALRGDASESFAFAEFFPDAVKPFVANFSNQVFQTLVAVKICAPFAAGDQSAAQSNSFMQRNVPGGARAEAERRRALALKALDQRLNAATASPSKSAPPPVAASVQVQPQTGSQPAMLGETSYVPEGEGENNN